MGLGILFMISAAFMQACISAIVKSISSDVPISLQIGAYYLLPIFYFLPLIFKNGLGLYKTKTLLVHFVRGLFHISAVSCFFYSIKYIPLGVSTTLFNMIPFFVPLIAYFSLKEKISLKTYLGLSIALPGVLLIINPRFASFSIFHFIVGISAAILMAAAMVLLRHLVKQKESVNQIIFNQYLSCSMLSILFICSESLLNPLSFEAAKSHMNIPMILFLIGLALLSIGTQYCFSKAAQRMPASQFAPFLYLSVPISSMLGFLVWKQNLSLPMMIGSSLIFAGLLICSLWREKAPIAVKK